MTPSLTRHQAPTCADADKRCGPLRLVILQSTSLCNIDCDYCYLPDRASRNVMPQETVAAVFERIFSSTFIRTGAGNGFTVCWHAGEPLTLPVAYYSQAIATIEDLRTRLAPEVSVSYSFQTNATTIDAQWCDLIKRHPFNLGVSIDGPAFIHDAWRKDRRGRGTHARTLRGIDTLRRHRVPFTAIAVLTAQALDHADEMFDFFDSQGIHRVGFNVEEIEGIHDQSSLQAGGVESRLRAFYQRFWERVAASRGRFWVREFEQVGEYLMRGRPTIRNQLSTPLCILSVDHQGSWSTYSPELLAMKSDDYGDFVLGNLTHEPLTTPDSNAKLARIDCDIQAGVRRCRDACAYYDLCGGGAPSNKYWEAGSFDTMETLACRYAKQLPFQVAIDNLERAIDGAVQKEEYHV